jgi:hypothetical protein
MSSSDGPDVPGDDGRAARVIRTLAGLVSLLYSLALVWFMIPEHQKRLYLMRLSQAIQNSARSAARLAGERAMQQEARSGVPNYLLPYGLSLLADRAVRAYDRWRYTQ